MMGHKAKLNGAELDVMTRWRRWMCYTSRAGVCKGVKRQFNKRQRRAAKMDLMNDARNPKPQPR